MRTYARYAAAVAVAASGYVHADLYVHGYRSIRWVGALFLLQASASLAVAILLALTASALIRLGAAGVAAGALIGFALSRTVGVFGFTERGLQPAPQALLSLIAEVAALLLLAFTAGLSPRFVGRAG